MRAPFNPADPGLLGQVNAVLSGEARRHHVAGCRGVLSLKGVLRGNAAWAADGRTHHVAPGKLVVLNAAEDYTLTIETPAPSRTFCVFFRAGALEEAVAALARPHATLLDARAPSPRLVDAHLVAHDPTLAASWRALAADAARLSAEALDDHIEGLAGALAAAVLADRARGNRLAAAKAATRAEILRRLRRAVKVMEDAPAAQWTLADMARAAALSPHHFHRCFVEAFGETPRAHLARRRMERAHALLAAGTSGVTEACLAVGLESLPSFSRAFRERFGVAPSRIERAVGAR